MKDKKSKNVVIIRDIASDTIEQAIFILRDAGSPASLPDAGYHIVADAQNIIDAYSQSLRAPSSSRRRKYPPSRRKRMLRILSVAAAVIAFFSSAYFCTQLFSFLLENF